MRYYVGFDSAHPVAAETTAKSIARFVGWNYVHFIDTSELRKSGHYWRKDTSGSTDFTYSRFLTPYLCGTGYATFCDGDFLWRKDPTLLYEHLDGKSFVQVVKHNITPDMLKPTKMDGKPQKWYPMKNWSSLMVFNCDHADAKNLMPTDVSVMEPSWLHGFKWTDVDASQSLPLEFNYLVGYYENMNIDPVAVHFTDGGPWLEEYRDVPYAQEWFDVQRKT